MPANGMKTIVWTTLKPSERKIHLDDIRKECLSAMSQIDKLSSGKWHFYRKLLNEFDFESRFFAVNRAFYKLWEMLKMFPPCSLARDGVLRTLHLAEAPGSFVQVIKKMYPDSYSVAISKPPSSYADVVKKGKCVPVFSETVLRLPRCQFLYCDLVNKTTVLECSRKLLTDPASSEGFDLITADGGFDEEEKYDCKETLHYNLILGEIISIFFNQKLGGQSVLKIFEVFTDTTLSLLWLLCSHYESFEFVKPSTSRPTNAERYVICRGFKGMIYDVNDLLQLMDVPITKDHVLCFEFLQIPGNFVTLVEQTSKEFARQQIDTINGVMNFIQEKTKKVGQGKDASDHFNNFVYIDKRQYLQQKKRSFQEWKIRFEYEDADDENADDEHQSVSTNTASDSDSI